jgi:hypothetical protein
MTKYICMPICDVAAACSTTGAASLGYPSGEPAAFAAAPSSGCASLEHPTCVGCPTSSSTAGQPSGSDRCFLAWLDRWQASGLHRMLRTADRLAADFPTCVGVRPPARPAITPDSHLVSSFSSAGLTASSSHRLPSQPPACAGCCCSSNSRWRLPPVANTGLEPPTRIGCSFAGFAGLGSLSLRCVRLPPVGPLMHPLLQPNLASPAEPSMSIPYPPVRASSESASF